MSAQSDIDEPDWPSILRGVQDKLAARIHTSLPGVIETYDVATQTATVQLVVQLDEETLPPLADVPVVWPGGAAGFLHVPLAAGDSVLVVFAEEDFSKWFDSGSVSAPAVLARHGLHAIAIPGLRRAKAPLAVTGGHATLGVASELRLGEDTASAFVALATLVDARFSAIVSYINSHMHPTAGTGPPSPPSTPLGAQASVAATKVKAI